MPALAAEFLENGVSVEAAGEQLLAKVAEAQAQAAVSTAHAGAAVVRKPVAVPSPTDIYAARAPAAGKA
jgi:hypothetical protein